MAKNTKQQNGKAAEVAKAQIACSLGVVGENEFLSRHVETRFATVEQRTTFKRLLRGLQHAGATTKDGRPVNRPGDVMRWMMENVMVNGNGISGSDSRKQASKT